MAYSEVWLAILLSAISFSSMNYVQIHATPLNNAYTEATISNTDDNSSSTANKVTALIIDAENDVQGIMINNSTSTKTIINPDVGAIYTEQTTEANTLLGNSTYSILLPVILLETSNEHQISNRDDGTSEMNGLSNENNTSESINLDGNTNEDRSQIQSGNDSSNLESGAVDENGPGGENMTEESDSQGDVLIENSSVIDSENMEEHTELLTETEFGPVNGLMWRESDDIVAYLDIPYGRFNVFEPPYSPEYWEEPLDIQEHTSRCPQMDGQSFVGSSDCLTLSIFAPRNAENASVLFYIHEGDSNTGSGDPSVYGPDYLVRKGIVLVLPNYRLGALGFLCLLNDTAPGNAALRDLALALEWVTDNIANFGGNPSNIAVSGDGRSGALAGYLALSTVTRSYISKVISDSGFVLSHWAVDRNPIETASLLEENIRNTYPQQTFTNELFDNIGIEQLIRATNGAHFRPCIELNGNDSFISNNSWSIISSINSSSPELNIEFMIGSTNHAGLHEALQYNEEGLTALNEDFGIALPNDLDFGDDAIKNEISVKLKEQYFGTNNITSDNIANLSLFHSDASYLGPDIRVARALVKSGATVYLYEFSFIGELNKKLQTIEEADRFGAMRGDLVGYLFTQDGREVAEDSREMRVVNVITDLWVNFIENGEPTAEGITWEPLIEDEDTDERWLSIDETAVVMTGFHHDRFRLWTEIYDNYYADGNFAFGMRAQNLLLYFAAILLFKISKFILF